MSPQERAKKIRLLVLDVDGVLSNGHLLYGTRGEELKTFHIADGLGIKMLQGQGVDVAIITGRKSTIVQRRADELGIKHLVQGREDKLIALTALIEQLGVDIHEVAYMGDDLPDLSAIQTAGLGISVANGDSFVIRHADWCSKKNGGMGAVREAAEFILASQDKLAAARAVFMAAD